MTVSAVSSSSGPSLVELQKQLLTDQKKLVSDTTSKADQKVIAVDQLQIKMDEAMIEAAEAQAAEQAQLAAVKEAVSKGLVSTKNATAVPSASVTPVSEDPAAVYL